MESKPEPDATGQPSPEATLIADALSQVQAGSAILVDVRRDEEWDECHFESARHIPLDTINENAEAAFADIDKQQTVFIHWRAGGRAGRAAKMLTEQGYNVVPLEVKYEAMKEAGFEEAAK